MFDVQIQNQTNFPINASHLQKAAQTVLGQHDVDACSCLTIVITDNETVRNLNVQHRGIDSPTDVLSFPAALLPADIQDERHYLGDLVIAYPYTVQQATDHAHSLDDSLALLAIHGTLHLLGYDHDTASRRQAMWAAQENALTILSIPTSIVPELEE